MEVMENRVEKEGTLSALIEEKYWKCYVDISCCNGPQTLGIRNT